MRSAHEVNKYFPDMTLPMERTTLASQLWVLHGLA